MTFNETVRQAYLAAWSVMEDHEAAAEYAERSAIDGDPSALDLQRADDDRMAAEWQSLQDSIWQIVRADND